MTDVPSIGLDAFLKKNVEKAASFELVQIGQKSVGLLEEFDASEYREKPEALESEIRSRAHEDASALGGLNRYAVLAHFDGRKTLRCVFRAQGVDDDGIGGESEPANAEGLAAQAMRHSEALMRQCVSLTMAVAGHQNELIARQGETISTMAGKYFESIKTIEELLSEKALRELEVKREDAKIQMRKEMFDEGKPLVKMLGAKVFSGKNGKISADKNPQVEALKAFVKSLKPEKFNAILSTLSPVEAAGLLEILTTLTADEDEGKEDSNAKNGSHAEPPAGTGFH